ncbi:murein hydrolase activator EnvC family protein [Clostridium polynesiense]|uniref:murein hydrolase activator EnvC family protein n=1 Tax=Clostridium polynesiense TaxID=1325933 RepID=UPI0006934471|nr:peptidoglycan DD-metalloendopeptidase family protein [Clostridium polynesiense]
MNKKRLSLLITSILLCTQLNIVQAAPAYVEDRQDTINQNKNKIKELETKKGEVGSNKKVIKTEINSLMKDIESKAVQIASQESKISDLEGKINDLQRKIDIVQRDINSTEDKIDTIKKEIEKKEIEKKEKEELLGKRLRNMYKDNPYDKFLVILLDSADLGDLIAKAASIGRIIGRDKSLIDKVTEIKEELDRDNQLLNKQMEALNSKKVQISADQNTVLASKAQVVSEKQALNVKMDELKNLENQKQTKYSLLTTEEKKLQKEIASLDNVNDELQKQMDDFIKNLNNKNEQESNKGQRPSIPQNNNSGFLRPTNGVLTSPFGMRMHPVYNEMRMHKGVDLASPKGTPIKASKAGVVDFAGVQRGYGNVVIINHGNGVQTLYAHANSLLVKENQVVSQGQIIATVGNTGVGTGDHLHFEVRINGTAVNPMNYIN